MTALWDTEQLLVGSGTQAEDKSGHARLTDSAEPRGQMADAAAVGVAGSRMKKLTAEAQVDGLADGMIAVVAAGPAGPADGSQPPPTGPVAGEATAKSLEVGPDSSGASATGSDAPELPPEQRKFAGSSFETDHVQFAGSSFETDHVQFAGTSFESDHVQFAGVTFDAEAASAPALVGGQLQLKKVNEQTATSGDGGGGTGDLTPRTLKRFASEDEKKDAIAKKKAMLSTGKSSGDTAKAAAAEASPTPAGPKKYECEHRCGFFGRYSEVETHELSCRVNQAYQSDSEPEPEPGPGPGPEPELRGQMADAAAVGVAGPRMKKLTAEAQVDGLADGMIAVVAVGLAGSASVPALQPAAHKSAALIAAAIADEAAHIVVEMQQLAEQQAAPALMAAAIAEEAAHIAAAIEMQQQASENTQGGDSTPSAAAVEEPGPQPSSAAVSVSSAQSETGSETGSDTRRRRRPNMSPATLPTGSETSSPGRASAHGWSTARVAARVAATSPGRRSARLPNQIAKHSARHRPAASLLPVSPRLEVASNQTVSDTADSGLDFSAFTPPYPAHRTPPSTPAQQPGEELILVMFVSVQKLLCCCHCPRCCCCLAEAPQRRRCLSVPFGNNRHLHTSKLPAAMCIRSQGSSDTVWTGMQLRSLRPRCNRTIRARWGLHSDAGTVPTR